MIGKKFNRWTVIGVSDKPGYVLCKCDCGKTKQVWASNVRQGTSKSCGCLISEYARESHTRHGKCGTRLYNIWYGAKQRCYYKRHIDNQWYSNNGVTMCDEWKDDFMEFYDWAMKNGYEDNLTLDRIDNSLGYSPENCRFATPKAQANNRRTNINIEYNGETKTLKQWAEEIGINYHALYARVVTREIPFEEAIKK